MRILKLEKLALKRELNYNSRKNYLIEKNNVISGNYTEIGPTLVAI